jgi:hypothetical protein
MDQRTIEHVFKYHPPSREQLSKYEAIRQAGKNLATVISSVTPFGEEQSAAILKVREAVMMANAAIACTQEYSENSCLSPDPGRGIPVDQYDPRKVG